MKDDVNTMFLVFRMGQLSSMIDIHFLHMSSNALFFFEQHACIILCGHGSMRELYIVFFVGEIHRSTCISYRLFIRGLGSMCVFIQIYFRYFNEKRPYENEEKFSKTRGMISFD
jgi:hypothetical protein